MKPTIFKNLVSLVAGTVLVSACQSTSDQNDPFEISNRPHSNRYNLNDENNNVPSNFFNENSTNQLSNNSNLNSLSNNYSNENAIPEPIRTPKATKPNLKKYSKVASAAPLDRATLDSSIQKNKTMYYDDGYFNGEEDDTSSQKTAEEKTKTPAKTKKPGLEAQKMNFESVDHGFSTLTVKGKLSPDDVQRTINAGFQNIRKCYENGLKDFPAIEGEVVTEFSINQQGQVGESKIVRSSIGSPIVEQCVLQTVKTFQFAKLGAPGKTLVTYPFVLKWESNFSTIKQRMGGCWEAELPPQEFGSFKTINLTFESEQSPIKALILSKKQNMTIGKTSGNSEKKDPVVFGFPMEMRAANLSQDNLALVFAGSGFSDKITFAGRWQTPSQQFVGTFLYKGTRSPVTFQKTKCNNSAIHIASGLEFSKPQTSQQKNRLKLSDKGQINSTRKTNQAKMGTTDKAQPINKNSTIKR